MPTYSSSPYQIVQGLQPGRPGYSFGGYNDTVPPTNGYLTGVVASGGTTTIDVVLTGGPIPLVGGLITVANGTNVASPPVAVGNVTSVAISAITGFNTGDNSVGTISYPLSGTVAQEGAVGIFQVPYAGTSEAVAVGKGQQFAVGGVGAGANTSTGRTITWGYACPSAPSTIAIQLEGAVHDIDSEYTIIGTSATTAGGALQFETVPYSVRFLRLHITATTGGTSPTVNGFILI